MKCEKCNKEIDHVMVDFFNYDGSDYFCKVPITEHDNGAVEVDFSPDWTGNGDMIAAIQCPYCKQFPFNHKEAQTHEIIKAVKFRECNEEREKDDG